MKKIFIITCNPKKESRKAPYIEAYIEEAQKAGNEVRTINIYDIEIDYFNFKNNSEAEVDTSLTGELKQAQDNIVWADQIVFAYPVWWLCIPAKLKSFIERVFQQGVIFNYGKMGPKTLLTNRTVVIMQSCHMPHFAMKYMCGDMPFKHLKIVLSDWCGLKIEKRFDFDCIAEASEAKKQKWLKDVRKFASKIK